MSHLQKLALMIETVCKEANVRLTDVSAIASSIGPGSYTGIRIGVTTARTLAQVLQLPCVPVGSLYQFKEKATEEHGAVVIFNARRGQVYGAIFANDGRVLLSPGPYMLADVKEKLHVALQKKEILSPLWYGDGVNAYAEDLTEEKSAPQEELLQDAAMVCRAGLAAYRAGKTVGFEELLPDYMRRTEAEQKLDDGTLARLRAAKLKRLMQNA